MILKSFLSFLLSAGSGNLICISHFSRLLCQQQPHFSAAQRTNRRRRIGQVVQTKFDCFSPSFICVSSLFMLLICFLFFTRVTAVEMVTTLAHSQHGRQYLAQQGIMDKISNMIRGAETDPFSSLYLPGECLYHPHPNIYLSV